MFISVSYGYSQIAELNVTYVNPADISIDGLTGEWAEVDAVPIAYDMLGTNPAEDDFKATFKARWSDDNLYLLFEVKDQTLVGAVDAAKVWLGDHIEMGMTFHTDEIYDVRAKGDPNASPDDAKLFISWSEGYETVYYQLKNNDLAFEYARVAVTGGYNIELKLPFVKIYPDAVIGNGDTLRIEINAGDSEDGVNRTNQMRWSGAGDINTSFVDHGKFTFVGKNNVKVDELKGTNLKLYPNPATERIYVSNASDIKLIELYNLTGQKVKSQLHNFSNRAQVEISGLDRGIYLISVIRNDGSKQVGKFHKL